MRFYRAVAVLKTLFALTGCSFLGAKGPPPGHETMTTFVCTEDRVLPVTDGVFAGILLLSAVGDASSSSDSFGIAGPLFGIGALYGTSSLIGFRRVSACRAAKEELTRRSSELARDRSPED